MFQIAIIGDIHHHFNQADLTYFNQSAYDLILCVGDLANWRPRPALSVARLLAQLEKPALFIPGNHDGVTAWQLLAEVKEWPWLARLASWGQERRVRALHDALGPLFWGGYTAHTFGAGEDEVTVITARPHAMGGSALSFAPYLARQYGVHSLTQSAERMMRCVDAAASQQLIFLAHNGPTGLGDQATDIWGCDFRPAQGDFGDKDLRIAIDYARQQGKRVLAVIAGHMHQQTKNGQIRPWYSQQDGISYLNPARVPRIFRQGKSQVHYYLSLTLNQQTLTAAEQYIPGMISRHHYT